MLSLENDELRRNFYIVWSNEIKQKDLFRCVLDQVTNFFKTYFLTIDENLPEKDILYCLCKPSNEHRLSTTVNAMPISVDLKVSDYPVCTPIYVSDELLVANERTAASSGFPTIGCQHIYMHKHVVDSSTSNSSASEEILDPCIEPVLKKLKICQKAKFAPLRGELRRHRQNSTLLIGDKTVVDILIFCSSAKVCKNVAQYLGLISLEDCLREADIEVESPAVCSHLFNEDARLYRLLNTYFARKLMLGCNNIGITYTDTLFLNVNANTKATIFTKLDFPSNVVDLSKYSNFYGKINDETNILEYLSCITQIINKVLKTESSVTACFMHKQKNKYYKIELSLVSAIPLYILRFFSEVVKRQSEIEYSFSSI